MIKNILSLIIASIISIVALGQQQPENPGFENWEDVGLNIPEPIDWSSIKTSDGGSFLNGMAPYVWEQSTDAHTGTYSVKLINGSVIGIVAAGTVTNGRIHAEMSGTGWAYTIPADAQWNTPFTQKPDSIAVWLKHAPAGSDAAQVKALLHTGSAKIPDATSTNYIAMAEINVPATTPTWTRFSAPFNYLNSNDPEYILIVVSAADESATLGTESYFDDIELIYNPLVLDLIAFMEGPYAGGSQMNTGLNPDYIPLSQPYNTAPWNYAGTESVVALPNTNIVDWLLVELRDAATATAATSATIIAQQAAFLLQDGSIVGMDGTSRLSFDNIINENMFVVIKHRNHLGIMSANPLVKTDGYYAYAFSDAAGNIYGGAAGAKQLETFGQEVWGMIAGDGDANGTVNNVDKTSFWSILSGKSGYLSGDYNMDGQINNSDKNEAWLINIDESTQVPN